MENITPEALEARLKDEKEIEEKIHLLSDTIINVLQEIGSSEGIDKIRNIRLTLVIQKEIYDHLFVIYSEIRKIYKQLNTLLQRKEFDEQNREIIQKRVAEIVDEQIFLMQREVFFKTVNAKEIAEGEKNEDGPAMLFPGVEKAKNGIIKSIQLQTEKLRPVAVDICKKFKGIADTYALTEQLGVNEKAKYDTIYQTFEQEKKIRTEHLSEISSAKINDQNNLSSLLHSFEKLKDVYQQKGKSLQDIQSTAVFNYEQKLSVLEKGCKNVDKCLKPLRVLENMARQFPALEKQLDFFADSHYQAKAVMHVMEKVNFEMKHVFTRYNLESFTVVGFLKYKLNGVSHMYESIHYYYAAVQMENDMRESFSKRYLDSDVVEVVNAKLEQTGILDFVLNMHRIIAQMNRENYEVHLAFLEYKNKQEPGKLRKKLKDRTKLINSLYNEAKSIYKSAQKVFLSFLFEDLGATDLESQFKNFLKTKKELPEANTVVKGFNTLLPTKRKIIAGLEKDFSERFNEKVSKNKISAMALLKVKQDFLKEMLLNIQEYPHVQEIFLDILKEFIKLQEDKDKQEESDSAIFWKIEKMSSGILDKFKSERANRFKKIFKKSTLTERDIAVAFVAVNITPQEIESFSRLLPALPRNELQLDSPYGRMLLDIKDLYHDQMHSRGASVAHLSERIYEKRERQKLIGNISLFLKICTDPFFEKIDNEKKKVSHLISLQKWKYRKELGQIIKYWQYLVQEQLDPGQGLRGQFRNYDTGEMQLMMKYLGPDQLDFIERQLEANYDLTDDTELQEVEKFLFDIVAGLFNLFKEDQRIRIDFEEFEKRKKIKYRGKGSSAVSDILASETFAPHIKQRLAAREAPPNDDQPRTQRT